ncbi:MAG: RNA repair domain-containing protein [Planctomycetota bacterium]
MTKRKLRPSQDVYHRIRWDPRLEPTEFEVVHRERSGRFEATPLVEFVPGGRIPWSRVYRVRRRDGLVVWDREARRDLLFGSGDTAPEERLEPTRGAEPDDGFLVPLVPWRHGAEGWREDRAPAAPLPRRPLSVLSYNVLFERFRAEHLRTAERRPAQLALLGAQQADLIALQEVTPPYLEALLAEPWVQRDYWVSAGPGSEVVEPNGQVLLSRVAPARLGLHAYSGRKHVLVARFADGVGGLWVAVVHLTSNMTPNAPEVRVGQLAALRGFLERNAREATWLVVGDFNQREGEPLGGLVEAGALDLWPALHPGDPGYTFDPGANALAAELSSSPHPVRYDRVLLRATADRWRGAALERFACDPVPGVEPPLFLSDHFGLTLELRPGDGSQGQPVHTSALAVVPPPGAWPALQALRRAHDPRHRRWPPHVSVLYGFVAAPHLEAATSAAREALRGHAPFRLSLDGLERFAHRRRASVWLRPEPAEPLRALEADLLRAFPACSEQRHKGTAGYTPHLTVAQVSLAETPSFLSEVGRGWTPLAFEVDALCALTREQGTGFDLQAAIPLGAPRSLEQATAASGLLGEGPPPGLEALRRASPLELAVFGSWALDAALTSSDLDLGATLGPGQEPLAYYELVAESLERAGSLRERRVVPGELPLLRLELEGGAKVDLLASVGAPPPQAGVPALLRTAAGARWELARATLRALRAWASARQLDAQALGGLGGVAWAALAVEATRGAASAPEALEASLAALAQDGADAVRAASARLAIPGEPTKGLTPSTRALLAREARRALGLAQAARRGEGAWSGLFYPAPLPPEPVVWIEPAREGPGVEGALLGIAQRVIAALEESGATVRPCPQREPRGWAFGVDVLGPSQARAVERALRPARELRAAFEPEPD